MAFRRTPGYKNKIIPQRIPSAWWRRLVRRWILSGVRQTHTDTWSFWRRPAETHLANFMCGISLCMKGGRWGCKMSSHAGYRRGVRAEHLILICLPNAESRHFEQNLSWNSWSGETCQNRQDSTCFGANVATRDEPFMHFFNCLIIYSFHLNHSCDVSWVSRWDNIVSLSLNDQGRHNNYWWILAFGFVLHKLRSRRQT